MDEKNGCELATSMNIMTRPPAARWTSSISAKSPALMTFSAADRLPSTLPPARRYLASMRSKWHFHICSPLMISGLSTTLHASDWNCWTNICWIETVEMKLLKWYRLNWNSWSETVELIIVELKLLNWNCWNDIPLNGYYVESIFGWTDILLNWYYVEKIFRWTDILLNWYSVELILCWNDTLLNWYSVELIIVEVIICWSDIGGRHTRSKSIFSTRWRFSQLLMTRSSFSMQSLARVWSFSAATARNCWRTCKHNQHAIDMKHYKVVRLVDPSSAHPSIIHPLLLLEPSVAWRPPFQASLRACPSTDCSYHCVPHTFCKWNESVRVPVRQSVERAPSVRVTASAPVRETNPPVRTFRAKYRSRQQSFHSCKNSCLAASLSSGSPLNHFPK